MSPLARIDRLDHVHPCGRDRPAAVAWYGRVLGLVPYGHGQDDARADDHPVFPASGTGRAHGVSLFVGERSRGGDRTVAFHASARVFLGFAAALSHDDVRALDGRPLTPAGHDACGMAIAFDFLDPAANHLEIVTHDHGVARAGLAGGAR